MGESGQILELWRELEQDGELAILATVVRTQGSSYRLPGARLLFCADGRRAGSISGGCLEQDVLKKAWWLTADGPVVRRYDTSPDGEIATGGFGLGCSGVIHILLERVALGPHPILSLLETVKKTRRPATVTHILSPAKAVGQRVILDADGSVDQNLSSSQLAGDNSRPDVFVEKITPPVHLMLFGAGDDALPFTQLAKYLGWQISIFDGRSHYARREKFPLADAVRVREAGSPAPPVDPWTVAVVMTHSFSQDLEILRTLAPQPIRYLGILGPRKRTDQLLAEAGIDETSSPAYLHAPVGLDLGADGPEQVALAVIAEIQCVLNGRAGGSLRHRNGPIHAADRTQDEVGNWARSIVCA